jgi:hypothetical protein
MVQKVAVGECKRELLGLSIKQSRGREFLVMGAMIGGCIVRWLGKWIFHIHFVAHIVVEQYHLFRASPGLQTLGKTKEHEDRRNRRLRLSSQILTSATLLIIARR